MADAQFTAAYPPRFANLTALSHRGPNLKDDRIRIANFQGGITMEGIVILLVGLWSLYALSVLWSALRDAWSNRRRRQGTDPDTLYVGGTGDGGGDYFGAGAGGGFGGFEF